MDLTKKAWGCMSIDEVRRLLATDLESGLSDEEVTRRLALYGRNALDRVKVGGLFGKLVGQFKNPLAIVLLVAAIATLYLHEYVDAVVIGIALAITVLLGAFQEERASKAFERLNASQEKRAIVVRGGKRMNIEAADLVPGDLVLLQGGYIVPADIRIIDEKDITVNEAALTGEWLAVSKSRDALSQSLPIAEQTNMAWMGTLLESGYGKGLVVATGSKTQLGDIAHSLQHVEDQTTPLQLNIRHIAHFITLVVVVALLIILTLSVMRGESLYEMMRVAIALGVAAIPSGLPAAVTIVLAVGMETILKRGGLVRNILAAETLGATTVILTDKTGTLTEAHMKLASLQSYQGIRDHFVEPTGDNKFLLELAVAASDAFIEEADDAPNKLTVHGRPMEKAVVLAGLEAGIPQDVLLGEYPRLDYLQFTSTRRFGASLHHNPNKKTNRLIVSGEPETLIHAAASVRLEGKREHATAHEKKRFLDTLKERTAEGKRCIGIAYRDAVFESIPEDGGKDDLLRDLVFAGFLAFEDPIRTDVIDSIKEVQEAGAHVIMLTGDNAETARHIAARVGITAAGDELVIRGAEIDEWDDARLYRELMASRVIARALPAHKLRIARVLRANDEVVAMTGDGINDAPALRAASIGVAVGSGTEVAKEASDLVLIGNSFSIIVAAIEEGRRIIDNLKKIVTFLLSTSFSQIILIGAALVGGAPIPLVPAQILWANIVGGDLISFAFAFEKADKAAMRRDPRSARSKNILTRELKIMALILSLTTGTITVTLYFSLLALGTPLEELRTMMFVIMSLDSLFFSLSLKSLDTPIWRTKLFSNPYLLGSLTISLTLLLTVLNFEPAHHILSLSPLTSIEKLILVCIGLTNLTLIETVKYFVFRRVPLAQRTIEIPHRA